MKRLLLLAALFLIPLGATAQPVLYAPLPADKSLYSFADLYRLTVDATAPNAAMAEWPLASHAGAPEFQIRTVAEAAPVQTAYFFSTASVSRPEGALVFLAGLLAALWVAYRRIGYSIRG